MGASQNDDQDGWFSLRPYHPNVRTYEATVVAIYAAGVALRQAARNLPGESGQALGKAVGTAMAEWDDEICGNGRKPGPGPHFASAEAIATEMGAVALTLPEGSSLRADMLGAASGLSRAAFRAAAGGASQPAG